MSGALAPKKISNIVGLPPSGGSLGSKGNGRLKSGRTTGRKKTVMMKIRLLNVDGMNDATTIFWLQETLYVRCRCDRREWQMGWTEMLGNSVSFGGGICRKENGRSCNTDISKNDRK